jgi:hypothetical protein
MFTHIRGLKVRKMCNILKIYLTANKSYGQKTWRQQELWEELVKYKKALDICVVMSAR